MKLSTSCFLLFGLFSFKAEAQFLVEDHRCERDSLNIEDAHGRLDWAVKAKIKDQAGWRITPEMADGLRNYFSKHPQYKGRPLYPTFGVQIAEHVWDYPGEWIAPVSGKSEEKLAKGYEMSGYCTSSCYKPGMKILFPGGYEALDFAKRDQSWGFHPSGQRQSVMALSANSSLEYLTFVAVDLQSYTASLEDVRHEIVAIETGSGTSLKVTPEHLFIDAEGMLKDAADFKVGDRLLRADGKRDKILSIKREDYVGKVYNLTPSSADPMHHILSVEGYLTGSAFFQNVELNDANRHLFRRNLAHLRDDRKDDI